MNINTILGFLIILVVSSCANETGQNQKSTGSDPVSELPEITIEQQTALDALTKLQISSDNLNRVYSTFPGINQPCYPADTSFVITQSQLLVFMKEFIPRYYKRLSVEEQDILTETSVKAQEEYEVLHCNYDTENENYENGLPMTGTWIMPNLLGRRDVILNW